MLDNLKKYNIILGSKSPRRNELLSMLDVPFECHVMPGLEESYPSDLPLEEVPEYLACQKGDAYIGGMNDDDMIITADTVVICGGRILGKPRDADDAVKMLMYLSGRPHKVVTGVAVTTQRRRVSFSAVTEVVFSKIEESEARYYVDKYKPLDKAGAYGIQEWIGCAAVEKIDGSFYNVMGLPVNRLYHELKKF